MCMRLFYERASSHDLLISVSESVYECVANATGHP